MGALDWIFPSLKNALPPFSFPTLPSNQIAPL